MVMVPDVLPGLKRFLKPVQVSDAAREMIVRMLVAFTTRSGRMSCSSAAGALGSSSRHPAQVGRFLDRKLWRDGFLEALRGQLLSLAVCARGTHLFILDATLVGQQGQKAENTYSTGNRKRRKRKKGKRYGKRKHTRRSCHSFLFGLLITPDGVRIPYCRPHRTKQYCKAKKLTYRSPSEAAAGLIRELPLPDAARVIVLGDTAFDAAPVRSACAARRFSWIVPCNPERVLAGPKPRPRVRSLLKNLSGRSLTPVRLAAGQGRYVAYRRLSVHRVGPKVKPRTYHVHEERRNVHSVGEARLVFSTRKSKLPRRPTPDDVKILMTNDQRLATRTIVELYSLRWQIELFFKELKSTLGFHQYQFRSFDRVEAWCELVVAAFLYLEWYRATRLRRRGIPEAEKRKWRHQRTHGLCLAIRQASEQQQLRYIAERLKTDGGTRKLKRFIHDSFPEKYRMKT